MQLEYLERYQVSVRPPNWRLFDHIIAALVLETDNPAVVEGTEGRIRLSFGTLSQPGTVQAVTDLFLIDEIPGIQMARTGWTRLQSTGKTKWDFGHVLFLHLDCNTPGVSLEFFLADEVITSFQVNLGGLLVPGVLPETLCLSEYFGDASKLED